MYRSMSFNQRLVNQSVTIPTFLLIMRLRQGNSLTHKATKRIRLWQGLPIKLIYPQLRTIGTDHHHRLMLIVCLSHSGIKIQQCSATGNTNHHRLLQSLRHTQRIETRRAFVCHRIALNIRALVQIMNDGSIPTARTHHCMMNAMSH